MMFLYMPAEDLSHIIHTPVRLHPLFVTSKDALD
jgi:hypothetical protein